MAKQEYNARQKKIISDYYDNLDNIMLTKLGELVTQLYLCESSKKTEKLWERVDNALIKLKIKDSIRNHIMEKQNVELLATHLNDWLK